MRSVVVFPQPEGPSRAKKLPRSISSEMSSTATTSSKRFVTWSSRTSGVPCVAGCCSCFRSTSTAIYVASVPGVCAPVVQLLPELEVEEALGRDDAVERANAVRQVEQLAAVGADELDEDVELAG